MDLKLKLITLYLFCLFMVVHTETMFKQYCYDPYDQSCEEHILDCPEGEVISTDRDSFRVSYFKNKNTSECQTKNDECKNKTACCRFISTTTQSAFTADDNTKPTNFIKTECSSKSSCIVSLYRIGFEYDYINYTYGCISKDNIVDIVVNGSFKFTGNSFPTIYYLDYTGNGTNQDNDVILNRECIVTTTTKAINLTIRALNLKANDCCRFHISGYSVLEYCSQRGSFIPFEGKSIGSNTVTIRLENIVNKDGDSFLILVTAAGNVTIDCRTTENLDKQEQITCQYPTPESSIISESITFQYPTSESSTINKSSTSPTTSKDEIRENQETKYSESDLAAIIGGTVGVLVFLNIIFIIIVVLIVRRKLRAKQTTDQHYSSLGGLRNNSEHNYVGLETTSVTRAGMETTSPTRAGMETTSPTRAGMETTSPTRAGMETTSPTRAGMETTSPNDYLQLF